MNPQETHRLRPMEPAARILCIKLGLDPDEFTEDMHPTLLGVSAPVKLWVVKARELVYFAQMLTSLKEAGEQMKVH